jgi:hypothetical protein
VADDSTDFYQQKTDDELRFFTQNPGYYHEDVAAAAARELRRRGVGLTPPPLAASTYGPASDEVARPARGKVVWALLAVVALVGLGYFFNQQSKKQAAEIAAGKAEAKARQSAEALELKTVETSPLPNFDAAVERSVQQQLAKVPAGEKAKPQELRQYETLARRFWAAETLTEYVLQQAHQPNPSPLLPAKVTTVRDAWRPWSQAMLYSYKFGPVMADHLDRMNRVARQQNEALADLPAMLAARQSLQTPDFIRREADVQDLLAGLLPKSPATEQVYKVRQRVVHL